MARLPLSSSLHAANLVLALFTVGDVYASLCKKKALTLHLARSEGHERYFGCNPMQRKVLASSHQHLMAEAPIYGLFQKGRVLAQDDVLEFVYRQRLTMDQLQKLLLVALGQSRHVTRRRRSQ